MNFQPETFYHIYNQGNNRQLIFFNKANYLYFLKKMSRLKDHCDLLAYCLMPNHFHWLIKTKNSDEEDQGLNESENKFNPDREKTSELYQKTQHPLVRCIANLLSSYTQGINKQEKRSGSLFRRKTKSKEIDDPDYALICFLYIHQNPLRAGLAENLEKWKFSSFRDYAGLRDGKLCNRHLAIKDPELPDEIDNFLKMSNQTILEEYLKKVLIDFKNPSDRSKRSDG